MSPRSTPANQRVARMLSIVPWIAAHDGPRVLEVCDRFAIGREQLIDDLNVLQLVGLPPYTPDMLIEVAFEGDRVWVRFAEVFSRPLRLTPDQALGLVAAGSALAHEEDEAEPGPLATGLAKLADLLGIAPAEAVAIRLASRPEVLDTLRQAVTEQRRVRLDYFALSRDRRTVRDVDPYRLFSSAGAWYVVGRCHLVDDIRTFRADRIYTADLLEDTFEPPRSFKPNAIALDVGAGAPRILLALPAAERWVVETYPTDEVDESPDGSLRVRLPVASRAWLERLLLRLGPDARIVETTDPELLHAGVDAARRVLARYSHVAV